MTLNVIEAGGRLVSTLPPLQLAPGVKEVIKACCGRAVTLIICSVKSGGVVAPTPKLILLK